MTCVRMDYVFEMKIQDNVAHDFVYDEHAAGQGYGFIKYRHRKWLVGSYFPRRWHDSGQHRADYAVICLVCE